MKKLILTVLALGFALGAVAQQGKKNTERDMELSRQMEILLSVYRDANLLYVDSTKADKMTQDALKAMLSKLDPYTEYIPAQDMDEFEFQTTGKYGGIGSLIRQRGVGDKSWVEISEPYEGTPSDKAGLKAGDRLLEIDGVSLQGLGSPKVSSMLKGDPDTKFTLKYRPLADTMTTRTVELTRRRIAVPSVPYYGVLDGDIAFIRLNTFTEGSAKEVREALAKLKTEKPIKGLVLDLRGNGGGIVGESIDIINLFVPRGVQALKIQGRVPQLGATFTTRMEPIEKDLPLVVMINSSSASASEIVAGALQDLDRAVIVGQRSFGKGLVQSPRPVPYNGMLKITTAKYYTPSGRCIQALDYTHRREDGSVGTIPDSLIKTYTTSGGRKVYDGGGIMPDIKLESQYLSKFAAILIAYGFVDDFANIYAAQNARPKERFVVDDKIYDKFVKFMADKEIVYESMSSRKLKELADVAKKEKYDEKISKEIESIGEKIKDDKNQELITFKDEIKDILASSILTRWAYARVAIEESLSEDDEVEKAVEILKNPTEYHRILKEQDTTKN